VLALFDESGLVEYQHRLFATPAIVSSASSEPPANSTSTFLQIAFLNPGCSTGGALLFYLLSKLYERTGLSIMTNLSFRKWLMVLGIRR
jgi:hypothetical protein